MHNVKEKDALKEVAYAMRYNGHLSGPIRDGYVNSIFVTIIIRFPTLFWYMKPPFPTCQLLIAHELVQIRLVGDMLIVTKLEATDRDPRIRTHSLFEESGSPMLQRNIADPEFDLEEVFEVINVVIRERLLPVKIVSLTHRWCAAVVRIAERWYLAVRSWLGFI